MAAPRSTASQMQRGSGELQSTPTGFWKLQSGPAVGAGPGSMAAGIWERRSLTSAFLPAHMSQSRAGSFGRTGGEDQIGLRKTAAFEALSGKLSPLGLSLSFKWRRFPVSVVLRYIVVSTEKVFVFSDLLFSLPDKLWFRVSPSASEDL